jgi:hypothetical protein
MISTRGFACHNFAPEDGYPPIPPMGILESASIGVICGSTVLPPLHSPPFVA